MIKVVTSLQNQFVKDLISLKKSSKKREENRFLIEGEDLIEMAFITNQLDAIITIQESNKYDLIDQIVVTKPIIEKLSNNKSPAKMIGIAHYNQREIEGKHIIFLDNVQDPGNVGTIIRTALSFSYDGVVLGNKSASIYNEKVIQSSKGAVFKLPIKENISLENLKNQKFQIISTSLKNAINYQELTLNDKFCLVFGNEGQGISEETLKLSDKLIKIEMSNIDSLNVAVAAGIILNHYRGE